MIDKQGRDITYLRISLTDKCNLRCRYCMPEEGVCKRSHHEMMNEDEVVTAVEVAASLGIHKTFQRQQHLQVLTGTCVDVQLHAGQDLRNRFIIHTGPGDLGI